jgi:hypothetical protein
MLNKIVNGFLLTLLCISALSADLQWWRPKEIAECSGYTNSPAVAMNSSGLAIAVFEDQIFGSYDANSNKWSFVQVNWASHDTPQMKSYQGGGNLKVSLNEYSKEKTIVLDMRNEGWAILTVPKGVHQGKVAVVHYVAQRWQDPQILSDEVGGAPVIAQGYDGKALAVWLNTASGKEGKLMASCYDGIKWSNQGSISTYTSIEIDNHQMGPQLVMSDLGDALVVWKARDKKNPHGEEGVLVARYFDGIEEKWTEEEEEVGHQPLEKRGRDLTMNPQGEMLLVWDTAEEIKAASMNLMKYMVNQSNGGMDLVSKDKKTNETVSSWVVNTLITGTELTDPKACIDCQGNALVVWLNGYDGAGSTYFSKKEKSWRVMQEPLTSQAAYTIAMQLDGTNQARALWMGEGPALSEIICSRTFDFHLQGWGALTVLNQDAEPSLLGTLEAVSLSKGGGGIVMWYDFFQEKLFYAVLSANRENRAALSPSNSRRAGILYKKKMELAKRRAMRRENE